MYNIRVSVKTVNNILSNWKKMFIGLCFGIFLHFKIEFYNLRLSSKKKQQKRKPFHLDLTFMIDNFYIKH